MSHREPSGGAGIRAPRVNGKRRGRAVLGIMIAAFVVLVLGWSSPIAGAAKPSLVGLPRVTALAPASGPISGGTRVKVTGTNFVKVRSVYFGTTRATALAVTSTTTLLINAPARAAGTVNVKVVTAAGGSAATTASRYTYVAPRPAPVVSGIAPRAGETAGGTLVTITGAAFGGATSVAFGTASAPSFTVVSATRITAVAPAGAAGVVDVRVTTATGTSAPVAADRFTYAVPAPRLTDVAPASGPQSGGTSVRLTGSNFSGATEVTFGGIAAATVTVVDEATILATTPAALPGAVDVVVTTPAGTSVPSATTQFTYLPDGPNVDAITPDHGSVAGGTTVEITGTALSGAVAVDFGATPATAFTVNSATSITALSPPGGEGPVHVRVTTDRQTPIVPGDVFTYVGAPTITALAPSAGPTSGGTRVTVTGTGFSDVSAVTVDGVVAADVSLTSPTTLSVITPAHPSGPVDVVVTTAQGGSNAETFTYLAASVEAAIVAGSHHSCRLDTAGGVTCWGWNGHGQLGNSTTTSSARPIPVTGLSSGVVRLAAGGAVTCAVLASGELACWGWNVFGQLGDGTRTDRLEPTVVPGISDAVDLAVGNGHVCALRATGQILCAGWNFYGQLGDGSTNDRRVLTPVTGLGDAVAVSAGDQHTCARTASGAAWCWGANAHGQLGEGTRTSRPQPVPVSGLGSGVTSISAGVLHTCAVRSGTALCWGRNVSGEVGDGTTVSRAVPVGVAGADAGVTQIRAGGYSCAVLGDLRCWGRNGAGGLGNGTTTDSSAPVPVAGMPSGAVAFAVGADHACALMTGGDAYCWGENSQGQLGDGTTTNRTTAVVVRP